MAREAPGAPAEEAFPLSLFDDYAAPIFAYLGMALGDNDAAEETLIEVFRRAASVPRDVPSGLPDGVWLLEIARDCALANPLGSVDRMLDLEVVLASKGREPAQKVDAGDRRQRRHAVSTRRAQRWWHRRAHLTPLAP